MTDDPVLVDLDGPAMTLTLNRPDKLNAFTPAMRDAIIAALDRADADDAVRAVIVTGAGRAFCAGADMAAGAARFDVAARALLQTIPGFGVMGRVGGNEAMSDFKGRHFEGEIVLWAVRWYRRYGVSYRDLEQMMGERGVSVDHSTIYRWVQKYAPEMEKRLRWQWRALRSANWRVDERHVKVRGEWAYLYRAVDKHGNTIDFHLSPTRNTAAAKRFLGKALTYAAALAELKKERKCPENTVHRQTKYLNNVIEADHGKLKQLIRPVRGFKTLPTAYATIKGFEVMRALRKGQAHAFNVSGDIRGEARIVERAFGLGASALSEVVSLVNNRLEAEAA